MTAPVLLVTGGGAGIGRGIAQRFAEAGYRIAIADLNGEAAAKAAQELGTATVALAVAADVRDEASVVSCIASIEQHFGRVDCLCNNAGVELYRHAADYTAEEFDRIVSTNLRGTFLMTRHAYPLLKASGGCVVNISSVQAFANEPRISAYAATKAALLGYTRSTALDVAADGVRVNAVCPGAIHTAMTDAFLATTDDPSEALKEMSQKIPQGRFGSPRDVAEVVLFLASPAAGYITGTQIVVDGGLLARLAL